MKEKLSEEIMAARAAKEFTEGSCVNLGYGIPLLCSMYILPEMNIYLHAEQGLLGYGPLITEDEADAIDPDYTDAGSRYIHKKPGMCWFDMDLSLDMIRGGHLDMTVLGGLEVSEKGDLANWSRSVDIQKALETSGIGGSMDLAIGAKRVIVCMGHTTRKGEPRIVNECKLPLTAKNCVNLIITDLSVIEVVNEGLLLKEYAPGWTAEEIQALTEPTLKIDDHLCEIQL